MISYIVLIVACIVFVECVRKTVNLVWFQPRKLEKQLRQQGLVGNSYKLLYGDLKEISKIDYGERERSNHFTNDYYKRVFPFHHQLIGKYGENCFSWIGHTPFINTTDPNLLLDAFSRMHEFQKIQPNPLFASLACGLVMLEGDKWNMHRKLLNPAFDLKNFKSIIPTFYTSIIELVRKWDKLLSKTGPYEIDVCPYFTSLTGDILSRFAFGSTYEEGRRIFELLAEQKEAISPIKNSIYVPGWKFVPTKKNTMIRDNNKEIEALLKIIIQKKDEAMKNEQGCKDDLLGILIESTSKKHKKLSLSYRDFIDEVKLFYFVGHDTTSLLLIWTMILLSKYQNWQIRAREEVLATFCMNQPDFEGLQRLKIISMKMIIYEVLRLYPPAPSATRRVRKGGARLGDLYLPEGVLLGMSIIHAHHNPKFWGDDAKEFNPERFSEGVRNATDGSMSMFPFGWGPRFCIGQNLALIEAKMTLSIILQRFSFELSPSYIHAPIGAITLLPQYGAQVVLYQLK